MAEMYVYEIGVYWIRLSTGVVIPYRNWLDLQTNVCAAFGCSKETLWREIAWRIGGDDDFIPSVGLVANAGFWCGLWTHARRPYPLPCEGRWRRRPSRLFTPWQDWKAQPPDTPGGDWT
jgi:hypothetical protein